MVTWVNDDVSHTHTHRFFLTIINDSSEYMITTFNINTQKISTYCMCV
jgi:hypothetical protein